MKLAVVIPVYNHERAIGQVVGKLRELELPVILVDDGSDPLCAAVLDELATQPGMTLTRHAQNLGKGAAVMTGMRLAAQLGYSHALQIDSDGQHEIADLPHILALARQYPDDVIAAYPVYDASVPRSRLYGRYVTHVLVWLNTLSLRIKDSMCGLRIYPLPPTLALIGRAHIGLRMDFDTEILVRLDWAGVHVVNTPVRVSYPLDGVSHFDLLRDNLRITAMHTRLFLGMLLRLPMLLWRILNGRAAMRRA
ncbi:glycosyltransferase family 2 protein [Silvimonas iriomotensis]|uniref:Glycosyltransferase 2-like domain-containing protein n=1 Tax=Silvimonas iriomotensis TaxID=449662 RepID=A0ABQ2P9Y2_9NEIS|nr:glycosyltransferase family 2 protein [Silvimonas iriomotensis]GGP21750.1 hypothetical protein GCM10010970_22030 [Silvimonas iriomotensis]